MPTTYPLGPGPVNQLSTAQQLWPVSLQTQMNPRPRSAELTKAGLWAASTNHHSKTLPSVTEWSHHLPTPHKQHRVCKDIKAGKALEITRKLKNQTSSLNPWPPGKDRATERGCHNPQVINCSLQPIFTFVSSAHIWKLCFKILAVLTASCDYQV